jgi:hypothetical protein
MRVCGDVSQCRFESDHPYHPEKVRGPYTGSGNRKYVELFVEGKRIWYPYARYLLECDIGRLLTKDEHVHHINGNKLDDSLSNLKYMKRAEHSSLHNSYKQVEMFEFRCPVCGEEARQPAAQVRHNRKLGASGPFCSRRCAGKWSMT